MSLSHLIAINNTPAPQKIATSKLKSKAIPNSQLGKLKGGENPWIDAS